MLSPPTMIGSGDPGRQHSQAVARGGVDLDDGVLLTSFDAFQVETGDDPVVGKPEGEYRVFIKWDHFAFAFNRISASFSALVMALIAA